MTSKESRKLLFLAFESPWPAYSGSQKRTLGLLTELSRVYQVNLCLLVKRPLTYKQRKNISKFSNTITEIQRCDVSLLDKLKVMHTALILQVPYHVALVENSLKANRSGEDIRLKEANCVYSNFIYWTLPIRNRPGIHWIIDQHGADVQFWEIYAHECTNFLMRTIALINKNLTLRYCRQMYPNVARIISVSDEDCNLTLGICPDIRVDVIPNGVDCDYFFPNRGRPTNPQLLFTGTSVNRNMKALRQFFKDIYPKICYKVPEVELIIGGNFSKKAQEEFACIPAIRFTGKVSDLRPFYNQSLVFVNPFDEIYGSKLKVSEALAMGICVISFPGGVKGMPVIKDESVLIAHDNKEFAEQAIYALSNYDFAEKIGKAGRLAAEEHLDWKRILGSRLIKIVNQVINNEANSNE